MDDAPPIGDYALLSDCHSCALVSSAGSIDWCCLPRFDSASVFGRLLDRERGGHCAIAPTGDHEATRRYVDGTLLLETTFRTADGEARLTDCLLTPPAPRRGDRRRLLRVLEGVHGAVELSVELSPRVDYGEIEPWLRRHPGGAFSATGGEGALLVWSDAPLEPAPDGAALRATATVRAGERRRLLIAYHRPEEIDAAAERLPSADGLDEELERSRDWWRRWTDDLALPDLPEATASAVRRSALVLKGLSYEPTGAIVAAATTSLPEWPGGSRNWDYRFTWIRDAVLASRALAGLCTWGEADAFRRFVERTAAGDSEHLRIAYGVGGEQRIDERELDHLAGYRGARPVRIGNAAARQTQLDTAGHLLVESWLWHCRGNDPSDDYWGFLASVVEWAAEHWRDADAGIWEWRAAPKHFVHSKALCWAAIDCGLRLAASLGRDAPRDRWARERDEIRATIESEGYDADRNAFVQALGEPQLDAAALRLPIYGLIDWDDERMVGTVDAVARELGTDNGLLLRYDVADGAADEPEGAFLPCSFWLAEALARQGRADEAREAFDRAATTANDLGLFAEEHHPSRDELLGNFPQAFTHFAHIEAARALAEAPAEAGSPT